jgi:DNA-directed RNA polymerase subunit RPC12/RpoP
MKVVRKRLPGSPLAELVVTLAEGADVVPGEVLGYRCVECAAADETRMQVLHEDDCPHDGEHGERVYGTAELPDHPLDDRSVELLPQHPIAMVMAADYNAQEGVGENVPVAYRCEECGNADESVFEIVHDETCSLARTALQDQPGVRVATDGGTR